MGHGLRFRDEPTLSKRELAQLRANGIVKATDPAKCCKTCSSIQNYICYHHELLIQSDLTCDDWEVEPMDVEELAKVLHEAGREAVLKGKVVKKIPNEKFLEWNEITEDAREGRRIQARYLLKHFQIIPL